MFISKADVVIIGGGVIGTSIFYHLAKNNMNAVLLEKETIASGTSGACEGIIFLQTKKPGIHLKMAIKSAEIFKHLKEELDYDIEYISNGAMVVIPDQVQYDTMKKFVREQSNNGLDVKLLNSREARNKQPELSNSIAGATYCSADGQVNPIRLAYGFAEAGQRYKNARIYNHTKVQGIKIRDNKIESIVTDRGRINTNLVVNAAGIYAPQIGAMVNLDIPIRPRRGQLLVTEEIPDIVNGVLCTSNYIACKYNPEIKNDDGAGLTVESTASGNYLVGATREFVGFNSQVTYSGIECIAKNIVCLIPAFKNIAIIRCFAGLRPYTEDGLPILGEVEGIDGFIMAAGHEGDGIALSPITGKLISELVIEGKSSMSLESFQLSRFKTKCKELLAERYI
ncbi:MAG: FAD-dependent oxidoreductase [Atribacterota bacterium]|nr:FAD-dependent oxidoreductase [Atribacterota bacterium]MDD5637177.1 FAD-dependent oxidoreductase [Atribacterota bacterium]